METMRAAVWTGGRSFELQEQPIPDPGPGQVRVRVHACGVCLTDVHTIDGLLPQTPPPRILGHEWGGTVDAIGTGVTGLEVGLPVACRLANGFAEAAIVDADRVYPLPPGAPLDEVTFVEPLTCCMSAVQNARLVVGSTALITGAGPMGLMLLQLARRGGAARVLVSEPNPLRRELARRLGADAVVDPNADVLAEEVAELTHGKGVDAAFETAGHPVPLNDCLASVGDGGTIVMVGINSVASTFQLPLYAFHRKNLTLRGSYAINGGGGFDQAVNWLGQLDLAPIVSHRFGLAEIAEAFDVARTGRGSKVVVRIGAAADPMAPDPTPSS
jgi:threonine dehydrogenase-like Zn-dependent dehydrogenase